MTSTKILETVTTIVEIIQPGQKTVWTLSVNCTYITDPNFQFSGEMFCKDDSTTDKGIQRPVEISQTLHNATSRWDSCVAGTLRGLNFEDFADLEKIAKLSPGEKFATSHSRN